MNAEKTTGARKYRGWVEYRTTAGVWSEYDGFSSRAGAIKLARTLGDCHSVAVARVLEHTTGRNSSASQAGGAGWVVFTTRKPPRGLQETMRAAHDDCDGSIAAMERWNKTNRTAYRYSGAEWMADKHLTDEQLRTLARAGVPIARVIKRKFDHGMGFVWDLKRTAREIEKIARGISGKVGA